MVSNIAPFWIEWVGRDIWINIVYVFALEAKLKDLLIYCSFFFFFCVSFSIKLFNIAYVICIIEFHLNLLGVRDPLFFNRIKNYFNYSYIFTSLFSLYRKISYLYIGIKLRKKKRKLKITLKYEFILYICECECACVCILGFI